MTQDHRRGPGNADVRAGDPAAHAVERWLVYGAAMVSLTGVQLIVPALPMLQAQMSLNDSSIGLVTSVYLLPSVLVALLVGVLAEHHGRRRVFGGSLLIFGIGGGLVAIAAGRSLPLLLVFRAVQGIGFAGLGPLTITAVGDLFGGPAQVAVQGRRSVAMQAADAALPAVGGLLAVGSFVWPFFGSLVAVPLGVAVLRWYPRGTGAARPPTARQTLRAVGGFARQLPLLALQLSGFTRMLLKFVVLSYLPVLVVTQRGLSGAAVGLALGLAAVFGGVAAFGADRLLRWWRVSHLLAMSLALLTVSLVWMATVSTVPSLLMALSLHGLGDGLYGVLQNAMVAEAISGPRRATFVATTAAVRNLGKFLAPTMAGLIAFMASVQASFFVASIVAVAATLLVLPLREFDPTFRPKPAPSV